jgi:formylglycine-generating enzyme required for sulfatase activity
MLTCTGPEEADANFVDLSPEEVGEYIYLTRSTVEEPARVPPTREEPSLPFEPQMVTMPAGSFWMGTPEGEGGAPNEVPQHKVYLEAYAIGRYPVTNAEFKRFVEDGGYEEADYWTEAGWSQKESGNWKQPRFWDDDDLNGGAQPVVGVSWYEALAYCRWLAAKAGKTYRLPTEAEWEKAARGDRDRRRYPWGNGWEPERCNNRENRASPGRTTPVGTYPQGDSPFGVADMAGQVWEWCSSKYGGTGEEPGFGYPYDPKDGRENLEGEDTRLLRGGSWLDGEDACRCSQRFRYAPGYGDYNRGFRCARSIP